jgi:hypothetical protein
MTCHIWVYQQWIQIALQVNWAITIVNCDTIKYQQLYWSPIVKFFLINILLNIPVLSCAGPEVSDDENRPIKVTNSKSSCRVLDKGRWNTWQPQILSKLMTEISYNNRTKQEYYTWDGASNESQRSSATPCQETNGIQGKSRDECWQIMHLSTQNTSSLSKLISLPSNNVNWQLMWWSCWSTNKCSNSRPYPGKSDPDLLPDWNQHSGCLLRHTVKSTELSIPIKIL